MLRTLPVDTHLNYGPLRMQIYAMGLDVRVDSVDRLDGNLSGCYCERTHTILIDRRLTYTAKRCTLVHELVHWMHADTGCGVRERRTRLETARRLIDQTDYMLAERVYEGDVWHIAEELNVTPQVVLDYRMWLHETLG